MNIEQLEKILRNPPSIKTPARLLEKLNAEIVLPRIKSGREDWVAPTPWFKRWLPALSFTIIFLVCLVAIAVQTNLVSALRRENQKLQSNQVDLEALRAENEQVQKLRIQNQELDRLRKDNAELQQLRDEVARLRAQLSDLAALRAENARLHAMASSNATAANRDGDFFAGAKEKAERIKCVNNLKQIGLAARVWSGDKNGLYPTNFICMSNELSTWVVLQCPSDKSRNVSSWGDVAAGNISYIMDTPGISETYPQAIYVECPIHHNVCLVDGSVQQLSPDPAGGWGVMSQNGEFSQHIKVINGLKSLVP